MPTARPNKLKHCKNKLKESRWHFKTWLIAYNNNPRFYSLDVTIKFSNLMI